MKLYNTLNRKIENFEPKSGKNVSFFVCGPTVYDYSHLGHAKTYVQMDLLARVLRANGYRVFYLQNITDIDDKIIARANEKDIAWDELSKMYEAAYFEDMKALNNTSVTKFARATDYVPGIIRQVQTLLDSGHAYKIDDGIYFEVATFKDYGKLSGRTEVKKDDAQSRIDHSDEKKGWNDFCLWKFSRPGEPSWDASFGKGRPGWHIEDTAITEHHFGPQYDIHGGAIDLIFPHHEAEITQMESISGKVPLARAWTHVGFLNIEATKMSKSKGNFFTIRETIEKGYDPMAIRLLMLSSHYRSELNFSWEALDAAQNRLKDLQAFADLKHQPDYETWVINESDQTYEGMTSGLLRELSDDLNTPSALSFLSSYISHVESNGYNNSYFQKLLDSIDDLLGLALSKRPDIDKNQKQMLKERQEARKLKNFAASDNIRNQLEKQGIGVKDTDQGQIWHRL